jgi:hypothetical protein
VENTDSKTEARIQREDLVYSSIAKRKAYTCDASFNKKMRERKRYPQVL